jgi:hypothetical protein
MFEWFTRKKPDIDRARLAEQIGKTIADYAVFVSNNPGFGIIRDEKRLPHEKEVIVMALCFAIATQDVTPEMRKTLADWALSLAYYQKGVGERDIHQSEAEAVGPDGGVNLLDFSRESPERSAAYEGFLRPVQADLADIEWRIKGANQLWARTQHAGKVGT